MFGGWRLGWGYARSVCDRVRVWGVGEGMQGVYVIGRVCVGVWRRAGSALCICVC